MTEGKKKILVVEDDEPIRRWLELALKKDEYEVVTASDGVEGLDVARKISPDLVITDLWMPKANGVEMIESLGGISFGARFIVLSAHLTDSSGGTLEELGVYTILSKPVDTELLLSSVRDALNTPVNKERDLPATCENEQEITILIADDDATVRNFLKTYLSRKGYDIELAANGVEAIEKTLAYDIDLILMDLHMPLMGGAKAIDAIKKASRDICIACITGEAGSKEINAARAAGASSCLRKPFQLKELLAEIKRLESIAMHRKNSSSLSESGNKAKLLPMKVIGAERPVFRRKTKWAVIITVVVLAFLLTQGILHWISQPPTEIIEPTNTLELLQELNNRQNEDPRNSNQWKSQP